MRPFLYRVAEQFYTRYNSDIHNLAFVFPNRRAGIFFQKYLAELAGKPIFSPAILTINDLFARLSGKQSADRLQMLFLLYRIYLEKSRATESFDEFVYWGEMLLNDFDDVDKYMVDAKRLFSNISDLKAIDNEFSFLEQEQIDAIRMFWSSFYPKHENPNQQKFLALWELLYELYCELKRCLAKENKGYDGMIFREVAENLQKADCCKLTYKKIVFVGLNALSVSEEKLLLKLKQFDIADFYWDYESPQVTDSQNKASFFVLRNLKNFPSKYPLPEDMPGFPKIEVIGIPSGIGQAKQVYPLLEQWAENGSMSNEEALRTAIVLPDETLLMPVLNSIPESIHNINVTMGYPLSGTPIAILVDQILTLQKNVRYNNGQATYYYRNVLPILNHAYINATAPDAISDLVKDITNFNKIYIPADELAVTPLLKTVFTAIDEDKANYSSYIIRMLEELSCLIESLSSSSSDKGDIPDSRQTVSTMQDVELEFIFHYHSIVNRIDDIIRENGIRMQIETYLHLLKRATEMMNIPFQGEPLSGLQIMGILETRALDFDRLIILSANEGVFPAKKTANTFIPYNLRRGFGLPTYEHQDGIWAYHFYRLLYRSKEVKLIYDTRNNGLQTGEVSRFVHQLRYHYQVPLLDTLITYNIAPGKSHTLSINKTDTVLSKLEMFKREGEKSLSASAINTYIDCPLKFYFSYIEDIKEEDEISETVESNLFGSILHRVMEHIYQPLCGRSIDSECLKNIRKDKQRIEHLIEAAFAELFFKTENIRPLTGQNYLVGSMIYKYVDKILEEDAKLSPFTYIKSEKLIRSSICLNDGTSVFLKGFIDRIDRINGITRIVDYKSGTGKSDFKNVDSLFDSSEKNRSKAVMQVFLYAMMYKGLFNSATIEPHIYYVRTLFNRFDSHIYHHVERGKNIPVNNYDDYAETFENGLRACLDKIFDKSTPFQQTEDTQYCSYCQFRAICGR